LLGKFLEFRLFECSEEANRRELNCREIFIPPLSNEVKEAKTRELDAPEFLLEGLAVQLTLHCLPMQPRLLQIFFVTQVIKELYCSSLFV
jgi:hypothetical protein